MDFKMKERVMASETAMINGCYVINKPAQSENQKTENFQSRMQKISERKLRVPLVAKIIQFRLIGIYLLNSRKKIVENQ